MLVHKVTGKRRYKDVTENETLHGFERGHTLQAYSTKERRLNPQGALDARGRLLGNCCHPMVVAFLLAELAAELGIIEQVVGCPALRAPASCVGQCAAVGRR